MERIAPVLPDDDGAPEQPPAMPSSCRVVLMRSSESRNSSSSSHGDSGVLSVEQGAAPVSFEALSMPLPQFQKQHVQAFDSKPWLASMSLGQLKKFMYCTCGNDFGFLTQRRVLHNQLDPVALEADDLNALNHCCVMPLIKSSRSSLAQVFNPQGLQTDVYVIHTHDHNCKDFLARLEWFAHCVVKENLVDKRAADDVSFWIHPFSFNQSRDRDLSYAAGHLTEKPFAQALERARCVLVVLDKTVLAFQRLWVLYEIYYAHSIGKSMEGSVADVSAASRGLVNLSVKSARLSNNQDRCRILDDLKKFSSSTYGLGLDGITECLLDVMRGIYLKCIAREQNHGELSPAALLQGLQSRKARRELSINAGQLATVYGNVEMVSMCQEYLEQHVSLENDSLLHGGSQQCDAPQSNLSDAGADGDGATCPPPHQVVDVAAAPEDVVHDLPPPIPVEALELFNIGVDFSQRISILWAANLQWPEFFRQVMRWLVSIFSFDLGIIVPSLAPGVRAVAAWAVPVLIILAVRIIDILHGTSGSTWDMLFSHRWLITRGFWALLFGLIAIPLGALGVATPVLREPLLVVVAYWLLVNVIVAFLVSFARAQARRTHIAAERHGLDDDAMMAGFHKFMHHSLCTSAGLFFVASWLPPVRACLETVQHGDTADDRRVFALGIAMMIVAISAFSLLPSLLGALMYGQNTKTKCLGLPIACLWPAPCSTVLFITTVLLFRLLLIRGSSELMIASGFMLPWNVVLPVASIALSLRMFRSHPFGALIAGDFRFQHHRIIAFMLRAGFAAAVVMSAMLSSGHDIGVIHLMPGVVVLSVNLLYIIVFRPYAQKVGNVLDATSAVVLVLILFVPVFPRGIASDIFLASVPLIFITLWICSLRPRATVRALWYSPTRMRAKLQATIHSPEWIYARPIPEIAQMHPQELIFWGFKHVAALADRCQANSSSQDEMPKLRMLLRLAALHAQDPAARLAAADAMEAQGFGDEEIHTAALEAQLERHAKDLGSTDACMRCAAAKGIGSVGVAAARHADALAARCCDGEQMVRVEAARALGQIGVAASAHTGILAEMLTDKDEETRLAAAQALGQMGGAAFDQRQALSQKLRKDHPFLGVAAAWAFGQKQKVTSKASQ